MVRSLIITAYCEFTAESESERILKIGQHLAKLWASIRFFLPRDHMRKRGLCCRPVFVRRSVCPSVTLGDCTQTAEDIVIFLVRPSSPTTNVLTPCADTQFQVYLYTCINSKPCVLNTKLLFRSNRKLYIGLT